MFCEIIFKKISILLFRETLVWSGLMSTIFGKAFGLRTDTVGNCQGQDGGDLAYLLSVKMVRSVSSIVLSRSIDLP